MIEQSSSSTANRAASFRGVDAGVLQSKADNLADLRTLKAGLDLRRREIEEGRRRVIWTQRRLADRLSEYQAHRAGLRTELNALGKTGQHLGESLEAQRSLLQRQSEMLDGERFTRDVLQDEVRRLRRIAAEQSVPEGPGELRAAPQNDPLWSSVSEERQQRQRAARSSWAAHSQSSSGGYG
eukprot:TRINITY_DN33154_c1_g1_i1.p1 TRINITY_DN33154_c1_g1~~TRINITY_DN33154_c1_g1_i1.p1  ORF type:complete len:182 (+),score=46.72 TRINITY_DN33154_c1_g1_i1:115-660(+)